jgi:predicted RNA-binding protein
MCLAKAYLGEKGEKQLLAEEVTSVRAENGRLLVTTLFGEKKEVAARIREIDFRASHIILEKSDGRD